MAKRRQLRLVPLGDPQRFRDLAQLEPSQTLGELLDRAPALSLEPLSPEEVALPLDRFLLRSCTADPRTPLYRPPAPSSPPEREPLPLAPPPPEAKSAPKPPRRPLKDQEAVRLAYGEEIERVASFLRTGLSVLVRCDKLVVEHLWLRMATAAGLEAVLAQVADDEAAGLVPRSLRQRHIEALKSATRDLKEGDVLVLPHLDLLAGGADQNLTAEVREMIEILYAASDRLVLAFSDRALALSEVLASRFAVRIELSGVPREVRLPDGEVKLLGDALLTPAERAHFADFQAAALYKNVSGMNPVRLRQAIAYAVKELPAGAPVTELYHAIRAFKVQTSSHFEVPDVTFDDVGGYDDVKAELSRALRLMTRSYDLPDPRLQRELIPRGFIFHGPPGTGKTLFAKAIANLLNATIQVVSGPEVTDMYVGESERKVRELFTEARRNAPAVLVFDEFDSIAARRSGREDGGSRAGNAIVAQILTEMDGFRPDVPMLVIGTSNRLDIIDEALLRPSRFQAIAIGLPDLATRRAIAVVHARHFQVAAADELLDRVAAATDGFNGDEIRSLFRDACVGLYCETPPVVPDERRLGELIARLRAAHAPRREGDRPLTTT